MEEAEEVKEEILLPLGVYNAILDLVLNSDVQTNKAFTFCSQLLQYQHWNEEKGIEYVRFGKSRFEDEYGKKYFKNFLEPLKDHKIIETDEYYTARLGIAKGYKVNPKFVYLHPGELKSLEKYIHKQDEHETSEYLEDFTAFYETLEMPNVKIDEALKAKLDGIKDELILNEDIPQDTYKMKTVNGKWIDRSSDFAINHAKKNNLDAILYNGKIYTDTVELLRLKKQQDIKLATETQLRNLNKGKLHANTDKTSGRLHHNFTNLPSYILKIIGAENTLIEVDAVNSQPALLANMLGKTVDPLFYEKATNGVLYEYMATKMKTTRDDVKPIVMNALFDDNGQYVSKHREQLPEIFPDLGKAIVRIEKENKERLSISLQKFEVDLFLHQILPTLQTKGVACCT
jgi:hypothetical protein